MVDLTCTRYTAMTLKLSVCIIIVNLIELVTTVTVVELYTTQLHTRKNYLCTVSPLANVNGSVFLEGI